MSCNTFARLLIYTDYVIGIQSPFWKRLNRNQNDYLGATVIHRVGYTAPNNSGFYYCDVEPQQRLGSNEVKRTISGKATPGTFVELVTQGSNLIVAEKLVDDSGEYRFENVVTASNSFAGIRGSVNYKLLLYPGNDLSAKPVEIPLNYQNLPGQINRGKSAFIVTAGTERDSIRDSLGKWGVFKLGLVIIWGLVMRLL